MNANSLESVCVFVSAGQILDNSKQSGNGILDCPFACLLWAGTITTERKRLAFAITSQQRFHSGRLILPNNTPRYSKMVRRQKAHLAIQRYNIDVMALHFSKKLLSQY